MVSKAFGEKMMTLKQLIEKHKQLKQELELNTVSLNDELRPLLDSAIKLWIEKEKALYKAQKIHWGYGRPSAFENINYRWSLDNDSISIEWNEYWSYQGEDCGGFDLPVEFVLNENGEQEKYIAKMDEEIEVSQQIAENNERQDKLATIEKLQKELQNE